MSKMDQAQLGEASAALARAWNNISKSGQVFGIGTDEGIFVQMQWETMRELFPDTQVEFVERGSLEYRWEAVIYVEGVKVIALLDKEQARDARGKEAE